MDKDRLVKVFDQNARSYDKYRPGYPREAIEDLIHLSEIKSGDRVLEIGCGTGQITMEFISKGFEVIAIEKGAALSRIVAKKIRDFGIGKVIHASFEEWEPDGKFKLMMSAQAFHWIDKVTGLNKVLNMLEEGGAIGLLWNVDQSQRTDFWKQTNKIYEKYMPLKEGHKSMEETIDEHRDYLNQREDLEGFTRKEYKWKNLYSKEEYLGLLSTFSPHMSMEKTKREKFFREIESTIEEFNDQVLRCYKTVLLFAKKRPAL